MGTAWLAGCRERLRSLRGEDVERDRLDEGFEMMDSIFQSCCSSKPHKLSKFICDSLKSKTHFDLCGCVLFPGSSNVQGEFAVKHD